ncbi:hypothetical protein PIB30_114839, partial [Stylosanthes scabra]|nr:hypothetical protein [Stylosanthes scabra]
HLHRCTAIMALHQSHHNSMHLGDFKHMQYPKIFMDMGSTFSHNNYIPMGTSMCKLFHHWLASILILHGMLLWRLCSCYLGRFLPRPQEPAIAFLLRHVNCFLACIF